MSETLNLAVKFRNNDYIEIRDVKRIHIDSWGLVCVDTITTENLIQFKVVEMVYMFKIREHEYKWGDVTNE